MGLISWIIIIVAVLALIGVGVTSFTTGVFEGAKKVQSNPVVANATGEVQKATQSYVSSITKDITP